MSVLPARPESKKLTWASAFPYFAFLVLSVLSVLLTLMIDGSVAFWALYAVTAFVLTVAFTRVARSESPFAPYGFPLIYASIGITLSTFVGTTAGFGIGFLTPDLITTRVILLEILFILGLFAGTMMARDKTFTLPSASDQLKPGILTRQVGMACLIVPALYRFTSLVNNGPRSWNETQGQSLSFAAQLEIMAGLIPLIGVCLILLGDRQDRKTVLPVSALGWLALWLVSSLLIGTRDELIAPVILLLWVYFARRGKVSILKLTLWGTVFGGVMVAVGNWRSEGGPIGESALGAIARPLASGVNTTARVVEVVPAYSPYERGSTYLAALRYAMPGSTVSTDDPSHLTATLRLPSLIGYTGRSGLGFSPVAESYWNFGLFGSFLLALGVGLFMAWTYGYATPYPRTVVNLIYPVIMSRTSIEVRSDFLQQYKGVIVVLIGVALTLIVDLGIQQLMHQRTKRSLVPRRAP